MADTKGGEGRAIQRRSLQSVRHDPETLAVTQARGTPVGACIPPPPPLAFLRSSVVAPARVLTMLRNFNSICTERDSRESEAMPSTSSRRIRIPLVLFAQ